MFVHLCYAVLITFHNGHVIYMYTIIMCGNFPRLDENFANFAKCSHCNTNLGNLAWRHFLSSEICHAHDNMPGNEKIKYNDNCVFNFHYYYYLQMTDDPETITDDSRMLAPRIVGFIGDDEGQYFLIVESNIVTQTSSFNNAVLLWFCLLYTLYLEYPKAVSEVCIFFQEFVWSANLFCVPTLQVGHIPFNHLYSKMCPIMKISHLHFLTV